MNESSNREITAFWESLRKGFDLGNKLMLLFATALERVGFSIEAITWLLTPAGTKAVELKMRELHAVWLLSEGRHSHNKLRFPVLVEYRERTFEELKGLFVYVNTHLRGAVFKEVVERTSVDDGRIVVEVVCFSGKVTKEAVLEEFAHRASRALTHQELCGFSETSELAEGWGRRSIVALGSEASMSGSPRHSPGVDRKGVAVVRYPKKGRPSLGLKGVGSPFDSSYAFACTPLIPSSRA